MNNLNPNLGINKSNDKELATEGIVTSVDNYYKNNTIRVKANGVEIDCRPLLPIYLMVIPRMGDSVDLMLTQTGTNTAYRWIGPVITDFKKLNSTSRVGDKVYVAGKSITKFPNAKGIYPALENITLNGRWNSDVQLGKNQTLIRAGQHLIQDNTDYNITNQSYSLLRLSQLDETKSRGTHNIVGEYINLLSPKGSPNFNLYDRNETLTEDTINRIIKEAHPMVYGDDLVKLLKMLINVVLNHSHQYHKVPTTMLDQELKLANFDLNTMLSKYVRLN
jgi:hypothetical protein